MICPCCGHSPSRLPFAVAVLTVLVVASLFWCAGLTWQSEQIRDQDSRRPQAQVNKFSLGPYSIIKVYEDGWDAHEKMIEPVKNGGKIESKKSK